jgi:hypothetical protein
VLGPDLDLAGGNPDQRVAVDDEPCHGEDATPGLAVMTSTI